MKILLTNDDGINSAGIRVLKEALETIGDVTVVAPEAEMSAVGHSITISDPLRVKRISKNGKEFGIAVGGTPADCVKIAVRAIMDEKPDLLVSGINHGQNVATNVIYSGTVSAATEGMILGVPSIAISNASFTPTDFSASIEYGLKIIDKMKQNELPADTLLNVNVPDKPAGEVEGIKLCHMGVSKFREAFEKRVDPRQNDYYWQGGQMVVSDDDHDADVTWLAKNWVTVTPIHFDLTNHMFLKEMEQWDY